MPKSFYTLEIFVRPGGSRMSWLFITHDLEQVRRFVQVYFEQDDANLSLYHLLCYGTSILVQTYQQGEKTQQVDLVPLLEVAISGYEKFRADELALNDNECYVLTETESGEEEEIEEEEFSDTLFQSFDNDRGWTWEVTVDWDKAGIGALDGERIGRFDKVAVEENYLEETSERFAGLHNTEYGGFSNEPDFEDLFELQFEDQEYYETGLTQDPEFCGQFLRQASDALDLAQYGFTWHTAEEAAAHSDEDYVSLAWRMVGDETVYLKYHLGTNEFRINCAFVFEVRADLTKAFFDAFTQRYFDPATKLFPEFGNYNQWQLEEEFPRLKEAAAMGIPRKLEAPGARQARLPLGDGGRERMLQIEQQLVNSKTVFARPVATATAANPAQQEISQFYTLYSGSLVTLHRETAGTDVQLFLEYEYVPDPENDRYSEKSYGEEKVPKADLPLDLYCCVKSLEKFVATVQH